MQKNYLALMVGILFLSSCGGNKREMEAAQKAKTDSLNRPENIKIVSAIAKVEPADGLISLSAEVSGIIVATYKKEGDSVKKGDLVFKLDKRTENLQTDLARQAIVTQQSRVVASEADIKQYESNLREKLQDLAITERLAATGADTRQNVLTKLKEKEVIMANLQSAKAQLAVSIGDLKTLKTKLQETELNSKNRFITARENGVLVNLNAKTGTAITAFTPFAELAPTGNLVLHGEIDEMFADRVKIGQEVEANYVGNANSIARGKISYLSPILQNKSLFYGQSGETSDRRVRQFKVAITSPQTLLINAKVECKIKIK